MFTVTFDQFNASLLNKTINFFQNPLILLTPNFWTQQTRECWQYATFNDNALNTKMYSFFYKLKIPFCTLIGH